MKINKLVVKKFRCFDDKAISFDGSNTILYGSNAIGKTSILEAVYCLGVIKSYRANDQKELIKSGEDHLYIEGEFESEDNMIVPVSLFLNKELRKLNYKHSHVKKLVDYLGTVNVIVFTATDFLVFKGSAYERRKLFDVVICQISKKFYQTSIYYKKLLKSRNTLLKSLSFENSKETLDVIKVLDQQLVESGISIIKMREKFINKLNEYTSQAHCSISGEKETMRIEYKPNTTPENFLEMLQKNLPNDIKRGFTSVGPQADDYIFFVNDQNVATFGSQGQQRNALLSTKLSEAWLIGETTGNRPIILLDDVFSELDEKRQNSLINSLKEGYQYIITTATLSDLSNDLLEQSNIKLIDVSKI